MAEFCSLGGTIAKRIWIPVDATDFSSTVGEVPSRGVDGLFVYNSDCRSSRPWPTRYPPLRGKNVSRKIVLSSTGRYGVPPLERMWRRAAGLVYAAAGGGPGLAPGSRYLTDFRRAFPQIPKSLYGGSIDLGYYNNDRGGAGCTRAGARRPLGGQRRFMCRPVPRRSSRWAERAGHGGREPPGGRAQLLYRLEGPKLEAAP